MTSPPIKDLTRIAEKETSFRIGVVRDIVSLVKGKDTPSGLKALTVLLLAVMILFSFQFCIFLLHIACASFKIAGQVQPMWYGCLFGGEWVFGIAIAIPLIPRLGSYGETSQLREEFVELAARRTNRRVGP